MKAEWNQQCFKPYIQIL